jgi:lipopolysaccharide transport system ATP-binding protein
MSSERPIIEAHGVTKTFRLGEHQSLQRTFAALTGSGTPSHVLRAVDDLSFEIDPGECFGIVGANGSGKSTLLQLISQITLPSHGHLIVRGRVLPLLAVGSGFHPELTGRENVVLFGTVLGLPRKSIRHHMDAIVEYADLGEYMDTPLKRFSSGMEARLSFAVAMRFPAAVSIFDEVLAVTDDEFTNRCLASLQQFTAEGRTVIFVSHDAGLVRRLCTRTMWLAHGRLMAIGETTQVMDAYAAAHAPAVGAAPDSQSRYSAS